MKKIIILFLLAGIMVQGKYYEGNGGWYNISFFDGCIGIGGAKGSIFSVSIGLGAIKKYIPGIGVGVRLIDMMYPAYHFLGTSKISPYLSLIFPIEEIHHSGRYYYPSIIYLFDGKIGIFAKNEMPDTPTGFLFGIGLSKTFDVLISAKRGTAKEPEPGRSYGIEGGIMGAYDATGDLHISPYIGVSFKIGFLSPFDVVHPIYPRIHFAFDKDKSFPSISYSSSYFLPPIHIWVEERNLLDASIEIKGRLASCVDKDIYYLGTIKKDGKRTVNISFRDTEYLDYVDGKIILKGKDEEGESYTKELEVPKMEVKDERYVKITNFEHRGNKIYFTYKFGWGEDNIPYRIKSKIKGYVVAKYRLGKGSRWIYTDNVYGDINKEVGYGEHKFYWDLTEEFPVEQTLEGLEFEVEIKK